MTKISFIIVLRTLTVKGPTFAYANTCKKAPLQIYLGNKEIYCIFKTCCIISVLFPTKCRLFHNFIFFSSNNTIFIYHALKFKYQPGHLKVKFHVGDLIVILWMEEEDAFSKFQSFMMLCHMTGK
jgi:hypothetical protein